jgi:hypothetical protein
LEILECLEGFFGEQKWIG